MSDDTRPLELTDEVKRWLRSPIQVNHFGGCVPWAGRHGIQKDDPQSVGDKSYGRTGCGAFYRGKNGRVR